MLVMEAGINMKKQALGSLFALFALAACADQNVVDECANAAKCGADETSCISDRQGHLGEISGRCGDAYDEAIAVYVCQGTLSCDERDADSYAAKCADELKAYHD